MENDFSETPFFMIVIEVPGSIPTFVVHPFLCTLIVCGSK